MEGGGLVQKMRGTEMSWRMKRIGPGVGNGRELQFGRQSKEVRVVTQQMSETNQRDETVIGEVARRLTLTYFSPRTFIGNSQRI